jgi:mannosyltransferase OCH1-like enzyme
MSNYKIPFIVHQTFYTTELPEEIVKIIINNKKICPRFKFCFYNDEQCETFIKTNFDDKVYNAYLKLNKAYGAMRSDFFRYCVLYKMGGVYLDIKSMITKPLGSIINADDICILDIPRSDNKTEPWRNDSLTYDQWLLIFARNHPYLKHMIEQMVNDIENNYQPFINGYEMTSKSKVLLLTGPDAFTRAINSYIQLNNITYHKNIDYTHFSKYSITEHLKMYKDKKHYSELNLALYNYS